MRKVHDIFTVHLLPAGCGDSIWIEYGPKSRPFRILIDGGAEGTANLCKRIKTLPTDQRRFELLVVTHIDNDHIVGILELLRKPPRGLKFGDIWFNSWKHLTAQDNTLLALTYPWNRAFGGQAVVAPDTGPLPEIKLPGGMIIRLLGPTRKRLTSLRKVWQKTLERAGLISDDANATRSSNLLGTGDLDIPQLASGRFKEDSSPANGSSIALVAEYRGKRCLFSGDAFASDLAGAVTRLTKEESKPRLQLDAFKISHHGGYKNTNKKLLDAICCSNFLISTDGSVYGHPDHEAIARLLMYGRNNGAPVLHFNYRLAHTTAWDDDVLRTDAYPYRTIYPKGREGLVLTLL
jgi:beta-lactamase superfamily II metal-dependent hydrolase